MRLKRFEVTLLVLVVVGCLAMTAQTMTPAVTVYKEFQPATLYLATGKQMRVPLANIFLKNSQLLYVSGTQTKEANIRTLKRVVFKDRTYHRIDSVLAYHVDNVGSNGLYCAQMIDFEAWRQMVANNTEFTNLDFGDMVGYTTNELANQQDLHFPVINVYYYYLDGKYVRVHERYLKRVLNKEQRRMMASVMALPGFSWSDEHFLIELLKKLQ